MILKINGINHFENIKEDNNSSIEHEGIDSHLKEDNLSNVNEYTNNISYINNACYYDNNNYTKFLGNLVQLNIKSENNKERKCEYYQDKNIIKEKDKKYQIILHL